MVSSVHRAEEGPDFVPGYMVTRRKPESGAVWVGFEIVFGGGQTMDSFHDLTSSHLSTRPNISESHSEISTRVPHCITGAVAGRSFEYPPEHQRVP